MAELELIRERSKLLSIFDNITEMINVVDPGTHEILYANESTRKVFGENLIGDPCHRRFHRVEAPCVFCADVIAAVSKEGAYQWELHSPFTDRYYRQTNRLIQWIDGREVLLNLAVDITDQKMAEKALKQSEANFSTFFNTVDDLLFVLDTFGTIIMVNDTVIDRLGYTRDELIGKDVLVVHPVERREEAAGIVRDMLLGKATPCPIPLITKDEKQITVMTRITLGRWNDQDVLFGVCKDISELRLSEEKFSKTFQSSAAVMALSTWEDDRFIDVNEVFLTTLGYMREEVIGRTSSELNVFIDAGERDAIRKEVMEKGKTKNAKVRVRTKDGTLRHALFSAEPLYVKDTLCLFTTMNDITDLKKAEEALRKAHDKLELRVQERTAELENAYDTLAENEKLYRNLFDNASVGMFQVRLDGSGFLRINKASATMLGYESPEEVMSTITDIGTQIYADAENCRNLFTDFEHNGWSYGEQPYFRKDGSIMIGKTAIRKVLNPDGTPAYLEGIIEDITEQKRMAEELEIRTMTLEEVNTALRVLVRQMAEDKKDVEAKFVSNVKALVLPYVEKIKRGRLDPLQQSCLSIIETNLNEIVTPFIQSVGQLGLTPRETQIATLIKDGKATKEIAEIIGIAPSAIDTYRNKIRHKLNLNNKKVNLQSYLQSIK